MLQLEPNTTKTTPIACPINVQVEIRGNDNVIENETISTFKEDLITWTIECKVCQSTVNKLLKIMKKRRTVNTENLPNDCRTLLQTPTTLSTNIRNVDPRNYYHLDW